MDFALARQNMVECQIRTNRVTDRGIISAMEDLPRESFLPDALKAIAYTDEDLNLGGGRHMMEPMILGRMLQSLSPESHELALVVGAGCGYEAAVLSKLAGTVVAVESNADMVATASQTLSDLGIDTVAIVEADITAGLKREGPFDVIFVNGAVSEAPQVLVDQLAIGGRMMCVIDSGRNLGKAMLIAKDKKGTTRQISFDANIPLLPELASVPTFKF